MFALRRLTSIAPRVAINARPTTVVPTARKAFATTSIARFLNTNAMEQKRATVQCNLKHEKKQHFVFLKSFFFFFS